MTEGHIYFTLSVMVCVSACLFVGFCLFVCVFQNRVRPIASFCIIGFKNNLS